MRFLGTTVRVEVVSIESIDDTEDEDGAGEGVRAGDGRVDDDAELEGSGGGVGIWRAASISSLRRSSSVVLIRCKSVLEISRKVDRERTVRVVEANTDSYSKKSLAYSQSCRRGRTWRQNKSSTFSYPSKSLRM